MSVKSDAAIRQVISLEGGYVNNKKDSGGETKYGISHKAFPDVDIKNLTEQEAKDIYFKHYWRANPFFEMINSPLVAAKLFVAGVNMGQKQANKCIQRALKSFKKVGYIVVDGLVGEKTLKAINSVPANELVPAFNSECACRYRLLACEKPKYKHFLEGWINRAYAKFEDGIFGQ